MRKVYHTSPEDIEDIHDEGLFGSSLFFSDKPYFMTSHDDPRTYSMDIDENDLLDVNTIPYLSEDKRKKIFPVLEKIMKMTGVDEEAAESLLSESTNVEQMFKDLTDYVNYYEDNDKNDENKKYKKTVYEKLKNVDIGELSWSIQKMAGQAAKLLGYKGAKLFDEQGTSYLIDMLGKVKSLIKHED